MKAKMMDLVVFRVEIYLGSSSCPSFLVSPDVPDRYRSGHPVVLQEEVLAEHWDLPECSHLKAPSLKVVYSADCWMELHIRRL